MTTQMQQPPQQLSTSRPASEGWARVLVPEMWGTVAIVAMWLAVLFTGVFGGNYTQSTPGGVTTVIPVSFGVAVMAAFGTLVVSNRAYGRKRANKRGD